MRKAKVTYRYTLPVDSRLGDDKAANLAHFLLDNAGSVCGLWKGHMLAADQRKLFGRFIGKGLLIVNGADESLRMVVTVCFGTDWDTRELLAWRDL